MPSQPQPAQDAFFQVVNAKQAAGFSFNKAWTICKMTSPDKYQAYLDEAEKAKAGDIKVNGAMQNVSLDSANVGAANVEAVEAAGLEKFKAIKEAVEDRQKRTGEDYDAAWLGTKRKHPELFS